MYCNLDNKNLLKDAECLAKIRKKSESYHLFGILNVIFFKNFNVCKIFMGFLYMFLIKKQRSEWTFLDVNLLFLCAFLITKSHKTTRKRVFLL